MRELNLMLALLETDILASVLCLQSSLPRKQALKNMLHCERKVIWRWGCGARDLD